MYAKTPEDVNTIIAEEEKITIAGAYNDGGLVGELKRSLEDLHKPFAGMIETSEETVY